MATQQFHFDICMVVHNEVTLDGRVLKEAASLAGAGWRVAVVSLVLGGSDLPDVQTVENFTVFRVKPRLFNRALPGTFGKLLRLLLALPLAVRRLRAARARVYHGHDFVGLLLLALARVRQPIVYDSHELFFDRFPDEYPLRRVLDLMRPLEKILARRAAAVIVVSDSIADHLAKTLSIPRPVVVRNAVDARDLASPVPLERREGEILLAHTGVFGRGRNLPQLVSALPHLPEEVTLLLIGHGPLKNALLALADSLHVAHRLRIMPPVPVKAVVPTLAQADVAAVLTGGKELNNQLALPNKLFEAIAAGVPIVASSSLEIARLTREYDMGTICDPADPNSIARAVLEVLSPENRARFRDNARRATAELTWEAEERKLLALYRRLLPSPSQEKVH